MSTNTALFYEGSNTAPQEVRVLIYNAAVHIYTMADERLLGRFSLTGTSFKKNDDYQFLYLDEDQTHYLQFTNDNPLTETLAREVAAANKPIHSRLLRSKGLWVLSFVLAFFIGIYFLIISFVPYLGTKLIGVEQEIQMGDRIHGSMVSQASLMGDEIDAQGTYQLQLFADQLQLSKNYPIRITLLKSKTVNAYALPGGNIVVYTGLLQKIKTPEALAALLAHECTHVNERHSLRSLLRSAASSIAFSVVFGDAGGVTSVLAGNAEALNGLRYSRSLEEEADNKGMQLLIQNGISLDGMRQLMQTLQQQGEKNPTNLSFLSTHPLTEVRLKEAEAFIANHPQKISERQELQTIFKRIKMERN